MESSIKDKKECLIESLICLGIYKVEERQLFEVPYEELFDIWKKYTEKIKEKG